MGAALRHKPIAAPSAKQEAACEMAWLLGQPHLSDYLEFVAHKVVGGRGADPRKLTEEWRAANDLYYDLEQSEAGIAEEVECLPLDGALQPLVDAVCASQWFRASFDNLPFTFARVELDKLVVSQNSVEDSFTDRLAATLGPEPDDVTRKDVLKLTADADVGADPELYFASKRPPILRDFFDPRLCKMLQVLPMESIVEIEMKVRSSTATEW